MNGKSQKEKLYPTKKTFCKIYSQFIIPSPFSFPNSWNTNYRRSSFKHGILALNSEEIPSIMKKKPGIFCTFQYSKHQFSSGGNKGKSSFAFPEIPFKSQLVPVNSFPGEKSFFPKIFSGARSTNSIHKFLKIQPRSHLWSHLGRRSSNRAEIKFRFIPKSQTLRKAWNIHDESEDLSANPRIPSETPKTSQNDELFAQYCFYLALIRIFTWSWIQLFLSHSQRDSCCCHPHSWDFSTLTAETSPPSSTARYLEKMKVFQGFSAFSECFPAALRDFPALCFPGKAGQAQPHSRNSRKGHTGILEGKTKHFLPVFRSS